METKYLIQIVTYFDHAPVDEAGFVAQSKTLLQDTYAMELVANTPESSTDKTTWVFDGSITVDGLDLQDLHNLIGDSLFGLGGVIKVTSKWRAVSSPNMWDDEKTTYQ